MHAFSFQGFCLPAEYSDEAGDGGATSFEDIEGGGLGEGEGAKDVSEQIESEDQLDDAKKKEDREDGKEDETQEPPPKEEEHGIEMSEDFDGAMENANPEGMVERDRG